MAQPHDICRLPLSKIPFSTSYSSRSCWICGIAGGEQRRGWDLLMSGIEETRRKITDLRCFMDRCEWIPVCKPVSRTVLQAELLSPQIHMLKSHQEPQNVTTLAVAFNKIIKVKTRSCGWALIQCDWCLYKKMILDIHMCMHSGKTPWGHREKAALTKPQKKTHLDLGLPSPQFLDSILRKEILAVLSVIICYSCPGKHRHLLLSVKLFFHGLPR